MAGIVAAASGALGCGDAVRTGRSPVSLVVDGIEAASGAKPTEFGAELASDVLTLVKKQVDGKEVRVPTVFTDPARARFRLAMKDVGTPANPASPSSNNTVTITRYRVEYRRTDGRNKQGVDVPYAFEGATTGSIAGEAASEIGFTLVRVQAKEEAPLRALIDNGGAIIISTIADVTFYGRDYTGNEVAVTGSIGVTFSDWGDPD